MVPRGLPAALQEFHTAEFVERNATPVGTRSGGFQATFTLSSKLVAEHSKLSFFVPTQPVRTEETVQAVISARDGPPRNNSRAHQKINIISCRAASARYYGHASRLLSSNPHIAAS